MSLLWRRDNRRFINNEGMMEVRKSFVCGLDMKVVSLKIFNGIINVMALF